MKTAVWTNDHIVLYQCNNWTRIFDYNLTTLNKFCFGYPIKWISSTQTTIWDNDYITFYQYKNLTSINNNIFWIQSLLTSETSQYYVLNFDWNFQWSLLSDNNISWLWQWKITNLWSDLWTINSNIWTLQSYFPVTDSYLWSTNITNLLWDVGILKWYFSSDILNSINLTNNIAFTKLNLWSLTWNQYLYYNGTTIISQTPSIVLWNPYINNWQSFTWQNQIFGNNQLNSFYIYSYNPSWYTNVKTIFEFGNDSAHAIKNYYQYGTYDWNIVSFTNGNQNIYELNNNGSINFKIYGFLQHQYWTLSVWNDAYFITFYQFRQLLNINNNILSKNALLTSEAIQYQVLNYNGWWFQYWLLTDNNIWSLNISKLWNINDNTKFLCSWNPCSWSYVNKMINNGTQIYLNKLTDGDAHPLTRVEIWYTSLPCNVEFDLIDAAFTHGFY